MLLFADSTPIPISGAPDFETDAGSPGGVIFLENARIFVPARQTPNLYYRAIYL